MVAYIDFLLSKSIVVLCFFCLKPLLLLILSSIRLSFWKAWNSGQCGYPYLTTEKTVSFFIQANTHYDYSNT